MARKSQKALEFAELVRKNEAARLKLGAAHRDLRHKLDVPSRVKESIKSQPQKWLGASVVAGFVGSLLIKSKRGKEKRKLAAAGKRKRLFPAPVSMLLTLLKPAIKIYVAKILKDFVEKQNSDVKVVHRVQRRGGFVDTIQ